MKQFVLSAFADEAGSGIEEQISALERNQISMIEIRNIDGTCVIDLEHEELWRISTLLVSHGISVSAIASPIGKISIEEDFEAHRKRFEKAMEAAELLGTACIRIFSFFIPKGKNAEAYTDPVLKRLSVLTESAEKRGLCLCHENEKEIFGEQPECVKILTDALQSESFSTILDPANYIQANVDPMEAYRLTKTRIRYFHIKDAEKNTGAIVPAGFGDGQIAAILRDAAADEGSGEGPICLTIEPHLAIFDGYGNLSDHTQLGTGKFQYKDNNESFDAACGALKDLLKSEGLSF